MNNFKTVEVEQLLDTPDYEDNDLINPNLLSMIYSLGRDAENEEEYQYALNILLFLCDRKSQRVRANAILAISMLAINHKRLEYEIIRPIIKKTWEVADDESRATIQDAVDDINFAMKWKIVVKA